MTTNPHTNNDISNELLEEINNLDTKEQTNSNVSIGEVLESSEEIKSLDEKYEQAQSKIKELENTIKTLTSVAATSQSQYLSLKSEFEWAQRMRSIEKWRDKVSAIIAIAKKFTVLLEQMRQFLAHLTPELSDNDLIKWFALSYQKFIDGVLAEYGIKQIESLGLTPDAELHEVVMVDTATESDILILNELGHEWTDFAGRIIREFEVGYYYMDGETRHVIKPSSVVVGQ